MSVYAGDLCSRPLLLRHPHFPRLRSTIHGQFKGTIREACHASARAVLQTQSGGSRSGSIPLKRQHAQLVVR